MSSQGYGGAHGFSFVSSVRSKIFLVFDGQYILHICRFKWLVLTFGVGEEGPRLESSDQLLHLHYCGTTHIECDVIGG